jgi:hypothetical protein
VYVLNDDGVWVYDADYCWEQDTIPNMAQYQPRPSPEYSTVWFPYEGFDRTKWPKTFMTLLMLYHMPDWYSSGRQTSSSYPKFVGGTREH